MPRYEVKGDDCPAMRLVCLRLSGVKGVSPVEASNLNDMTFLVLSGPSVETTMGVARLIRHALLGEQSAHVPGLMVAPEAPEAALDLSWIDETGVTHGARVRLAHDGVCKREGPVAPNVLDFAWAWTSHEGSGLPGFDRFVPDALDRACDRLEEARRALNDGIEQAQEAHELTVRIQGIARLAACREEALKADLVDSLGPLADGLSNSDELDTVPARTLTEQLRMVEWWIRRLKSRETRVRSWSRAMRRGGNAGALLALVGLLFASLGYLKLPSALSQDSWWVAGLASVALGLTFGLWGLRRAREARDLGHRISDLETTRHIYEEEVNDIRRAHGAAIALEEGALLRAQSWDDFERRLGPIGGQVIQREVTDLRAQFPDPSAILDRGARSAETLQRTVIKLEEALTSSRDLETFTHLMDRSKCRPWLAFSTGVIHTPALLEPLREAIHGWKGPGEENRDWTGLQFLVIEPDSVVTLGWSSAVGRVRLESLPEPKVP